MLMSMQAKKPLLNMPRNTNNIKIMSIVIPPKKAVEKNATAKPSYLPLAFSISRTKLYSANNAAISTIVIKIIICTVKIIFAIFFTPFQKARAAMNLPSKLQISPENRHRQRNRLLRFHLFCVLSRSGCFRFR